MDVLATLTNDMKDAMRAKDRMALDTVRYLMAQVKNAQIDKPDHAPLTDGEFMAIVKKIIKNTEEAIEQYRAGGREDLAAEELPKIEFMRRYLPQQLSEDELRVIIQDTIDANPGAQVGPLTGMVLKQTSGRADGGMVSKLLREMLA